MKICVLISGRGSNMESLARHGLVSHVVSNKPNAPGLDIARSMGITCSVTPDPTKILEELQPDLVCLAGYMKILPENIVSKYTIMNIHPSLLPNYPGLHAVKQALEDGATYSGCTIHFVDEGVDTGPIIAQAAVPVLKTDTEEILAARIMQQEHRLYPKVVKWFGQM